MSDKTEGEKPKSTRTPPRPPGPDRLQPPISRPAVPVSGTPTQEQLSPQPSGHERSATYPSVVSPYGHDASSPPSSSPHPPLLPSVHPSYAGITVLDRTFLSPQPPFLLAQIGAPAAPQAAQAHGFQVPSPPQGLQVPEAEYQPLQHAFGGSSPPDTHSWGRGPTLGSYHFSPDSSQLAYSSRQFLPTHSPPGPYLGRQCIPPGRQFVCQQQQQEQQQPPSTQDVSDAHSVYRLITQGQPIPVFFTSPGVQSPHPSHILMSVPPPFTVPPTTTPLVETSMLASGGQAEDPAHQHLPLTLESAPFTGPPGPHGASMSSLGLPGTAQSYDAGAGGRRCEESPETSVPRDSRASSLHAEGYVYQLRMDAEEFVPRRSGQRQQQQQQKRLLQAGRPSTTYKPHSIQKTSAAIHEGEELRGIRRQLRSYAIRALTHCSDPEDPGALAEVMCTVTRVPATCFNEQKFEDKEGYKVLLQPQSPAVRGQEALSRVCFALEQILRQRGKGAVIISDYKFKENYLRQAPPEVLKVLPRPQDEGSHDILIIGLEIGIVCVQVNCIEMSTNSGTVRKQVRETLKQLQKDKKVVRHVLRDLDLDNSCVRMVMALPNITSELLKQRLEPTTVKTLATVLETTEELENLLTFDRLPCVRQCHWSSRESRDGFWNWFERLAERGATLSVENYMQIFARYTCSWSVSEVWGMMKPRVQIRSWAHAVSETFHRYHLPVLTCQQDDLLLSGHSHVLMEGPSGSGATCLLKVKAVTELHRGNRVLVFLPRKLTGLRREYEGFFADSLSAELSGNVHFWSCRDQEAGGEISAGLFFAPVTGEARTLNSLKAEKQLDTFALFDRVNRDNDLSLLVGKVTKLAESVWVAVDAPALARPQLSLPEGRYHQVQFTSLTRVPASIQALIRHGLLAAGSRGTPATSGSADLPPTSLSVPRDPQSVAEVSSYQGLPTDGPTPLFIWHPARTPAESPQSRITRCGLCMARLSTALRDLVADFTPRTSTTGRRTASATREPEQQIVSRSSTTGRTGRTVSSTAAGTVAGGGVEEEEEKEKDEQAIGEDGGLDINSGNVPRPLSVEDVVIFVNSAEDVRTIVEMLDLVNVEKVVHPLADLPRFIGTERAVVGYVGRVGTGRADTVLQDLVSGLCDVMTLCQGQLILGLEFTSGAEAHGRTEAASPGKQQPAPYQLDVKSMQEQAQKQHG